MLHEIYIQQELQRVNDQRHAPAGRHRLAVHDFLRRQAPLRRLARHIGISLVNFGAWMHAYGADQPRRRLSSPIPPIVDFRA